MPVLQGEAEARTGCACGLRSEMPRRADGRDGSAETHSAIKPRIPRSGAVNSSIKAVKGHAAVVAPGPIAPSRSTNVRPEIVVAIGALPPRRRVPPAAVVIRKAASTVPIAAVVRTKNLHAALRVGSGRMLSKSCTPYDLGTDPLLTAASVLLLNYTGTGAVLRIRMLPVLEDAWADAILRPYPVVTLSRSRADGVLRACSVLRWSDARADSAVMWRYSLLMLNAPRPDRKSGRRLDLALNATGTQPRSTASTSVATLQRAGAGREGAGPRRRPRCGRHGTTGVAAPIKALCRCDRRDSNSGNKRGNQCDFADHGLIVLRGRLSDATLQRTAPCEGSQRCETARNSVEPHSSLRQRMLFRTVTVSAPEALYTTMGR